MGKQVRLSSHNIQTTWYGIASKSVMCSWFSSACLLPAQHFLVTVLCNSTVQVIFLGIAELRKSAWELMQWEVGHIIGPYSIVLSQGQVPSSRFLKVKAQEVTGANYVENMQQRSCHFFSNFPTYITTSPSVTDLLAVLRMSLSLPDLLLPSLTNAASCQVDKIYEGFSCYFLVLCKCEHFQSKKFENRFLIHPEVIFVLSVREDFSRIFQYEYEIVPLSFLSKNSVLSPISLQWHIFNQSGDHVEQRSALAYSIEFLWSICLCLHLYHKRIYYSVLIILTIISSFSFTKMCWLSLATCKSFYTSESACGVSCTEVHVHRHSQTKLLAFICRGTIIIIYRLNLGRINMFPTLNLRSINI